jgi:anti-sigma-K factor RskA
MTIDIHALSGAYAVDALDDDERAQFELHLAECAECRAEVASLREASALLAETTTTTPSAGLRDRVLADIGGVRPLPPETADVDDDHHEPGATVTALAPRRRRATAWLAAAAAAVVIGTGGIVWQQLDDDPQSRVEQIQAASDVQRFNLPVASGEAVVYRSESLNQAAIVTHDMPAAPGGHAYALWLQHDDDMVPAGVMPSGPDNEVVLSGDAASADGFGITIEEAGAETDEPEGDVVAVVEFDA